MFLTRLLKKSEILLKAKIEISESSSFFLIAEKSTEIKEKELILLGLLIYARILRVESSKTDRDKLVAMFIELHTNFIDTGGSEEYINTMLNIFSMVAKSNRFKDSAIIQLKKENRIFLDMGVINVYPLSSVVYTVFNFLHENLNQQNRIRLIEGFALLSKLYQKEEFNILSAVEIPNMIVYEIIPFDN
jgi:hypothetical protein